MPLVATTIERLSKKNLAKFPGTSLAAYGLLVL